MLATAATSLVGIGVVSADVPADVGTTTVPAASFVRGQNIVVTVTLTKRVKVVQPTGSVTLTVDGGAPVTAIVKSTGKATYSSATLSLGLHTVTGYYEGDTRYDAGSTGSVTFEVIKGSTTATIKSTLESVPNRAPTRVSGTAKRVAPAAGSLAGTITFSASNGTDAPTVATVLAASTGVANWKPLLARGTWSITATYEGNADFEASATSAPVTVTVGEAVVDQQNTVGTSMGNVYDDADFGTSGMDQTFIAGLTGSLTKISLRAYPQMADPSELQLTVRAVVDGAPSGPVLALATLSDAAAIATRSADGFVDLVLDNPVHVVRGTTYAFEVAPPTPSTTWALQTSYADVYTRGVLSSTFDGNRQTFISGAGYDLNFRTWVETA
ncbi:MAG: Ig domain protein group 1 domain protein [Acidimicrobiales bacterium]|nr:Ig domain protein group 1 domain protein [Acidimicrobiales bacterium]